MENQKEHIYLTIYENLKSKILNNAYKPGDLLPSENELCKHFSTSRVTIRKSLGMLVINGLVISIQGKGYVVAEPKTDTYELKFPSFGDDIKTKLNKVLIEFPNDSITEFLDLSGNQMVVYIRRILLRNNVIIGCDLKYIPYEIGMPILESEIQYSDFPDIIAQKISPFTLKTTLEISIEKTNDDLRNILDIDEDEYLLTICRKAICDDNKKVGYMVTYLRQNFGTITANSKS